MTPEMEALGQRAVACRGWRWMSGMLATAAAPVPQRARVVDVIVGVPNGVAIGDRWGASRPLHQLAIDRPQLPDLSDAATRGCLLDLVREAHGPTVCTMHVAPDCDQSRPWAVVRHHWDGPLDLITPGSPTEVEALVAALEGAP